MKNKKAFTLIELISVLVILAILSLIVTPLVLNIIKKARTAADKRSIDAYGRSIELAIADYLLDKGSFPTSIEQLTIEYSGDEVVCVTTQLKSDSSIYLANCTVNGRLVENYTYGSEGTVTYDYEIGDEITYNGAQYYVIKNSKTTDQTVTLLKSEPLTYEEIETYSAGTGSQISDQNGYGGMEYHSNSGDYSTSYVKATVDAWKTAKAPAASEARLIKTEDLQVLGYRAITLRETAANLGIDTTNMTDEEVWAAAFQYIGADINTMTDEEIEQTKNMINENLSKNLILTDSVPSWVYKENYWYWTMSKVNDSASNVWYVNSDGSLNMNYVRYHNYAVRPVIVLSKSEL